MRNGGSLWLYPCMYVCMYVARSMSSRSLESPKRTVAQRMMIGLAGDAPGPERKARRTGNLATRPLGTELEGG